MNTLPSGHKEQHRSPTHAAAPFPPMSGGIAPWAAGSSTQPRSKATAHDLLKLALCFICACLFTACLVNLRAAADVRLRPSSVYSPALSLPAYSGQGAGGVALDGAQ